nr:hypothetical protein [uncultured Caldimonas sp.]
MTTLELVQIDDGVGVILPNEVVERLRLSPGDMVFVRELDGSIQLLTLGAQEGEPGGAGEPC